MVNSVNAISTLHHAYISKDNAALPASVVLHQRANGGSTKRSLGVKVFEVFVNGIHEGEPDVLESGASPKQMLSVAPGGAAACMRALVGADSSCVLGSVRSSYAASNDGLQPALSFTIELAGLAYEVLGIFVRSAGEILGTMGMGGLFASP